MNQENLMQTLKLILLSKILVENCQPCELEIILSMQQENSMARLS